MKRKMTRKTIDKIVTFIGAGLTVFQYAVAALVGALLMLFLTIAGVIHLRRTPDEAMI
jgi:hypothetical protein